MSTINFHKSRTMLTLHRGRNVCLHYLLRTCKFGDFKCVYSHSKEFLPKDGWWTTEDGVRNVKDSLQSWKEIKHETKTLDKAFGRTKLGNLTRRIGGVGSFAKYGTATNSPSTSTSLVLLLSFDYADVFNSVHAHFLSALRARADVVQAETKESALQTFSRSNLTAVFVTDPGIVEKKYAKVLVKFVEYVKSGGTLVVGGTFSTFVRFPDNDAFFKKNFGLNWKMGSYHRTTFSLNPARPQRLLRGPTLAASYSMKTVHLKGISPDTVVYAPTAESRTQSMVFAPAPVDLNEAPVVYTRVSDIWDASGISMETRNRPMSSYLCRDYAQSTKIQKEGLPHAGKGNRSVGRRGSELRLGRGS